MNTFVSLRIQKVRKGCWAYACELCDVEDHAPDLFRAIEAQQHHEAKLAHRFNVTIEAVAAEFLRLRLGDKP